MRLCYPFHVYVFLLRLTDLNPAKGCEATFEQVWLSRDSHLDKVPGFVEFHLLKGPEAEDHTLYASHTVRSIGTKVSVSGWCEKSGGSHMDRTTRCPKCGKRMVPIVTISGRTDLQCISCDDPGVKWAESPLTAPEKPIELERA